MAKGPTISTITAAFASASKLNANFSAIDTAFDNTLSLDGSTPNAMSAAFDMGTNDIINAGDITATDIIVAGSSVSASAAAAAASAQAAATSETNAVASFDEFDDIYLGAKSSDPALDNDGDPLVAGALHFNTTSDQMRVYSGSAWDDIAPAGGTVSSVGIVDAGASEITVTNTPVTTSGSITLAIATIAGTKIDFSGGGNLDAKVVTVVSDVAGKQAGDATLTSLAAVAGVAGDILYASGTDVWTRLAKGTDDEVLTLASGVPSWAASVTVLTRETPIATTSGTSHSFTGIAAGANRITFMLDQVSLDGTEELRLRIGDAGGFETTGYTSTASNNGGDDNASGGFLITRGSADAHAYSGIITLCRLTSNLWVCSGTLSNGTSNTIFNAGTKSLSAELDRIQILDTGSNSFDGGQINIFVE